MKIYTTLRDANRARQREWDAGNRLSLSFRGVELAGEVGEACNIIKKLERERLGIRGSRATSDQLADELADVAICVDLLAMDAGIDLDAAVIAKFNATSEKVGLQTRLAADPAAITAAHAQALGQVADAGRRLYALLSPAQGDTIDWDKLEAARDAMGKALLALAQPAQTAAVAA